MSDVDRILDQIEAKASLREASWQARVARNRDHSPPPILVAAAAVRHRPRTWPLWTASLAFFTAALVAAFVSAPMSGGNLIGAPALAVIGAVFAAAATIRKA